jgi:hypothetical protein
MTCKKSEGVFTFSRSVRIVRKMWPASTPSIARMSGCEWFKIIEYRVLRRASGVRGQMGWGFGFGARLVVCWVVVAEVGAALVVEAGRLAVFIFFFLLHLVTVAQVSPKGLLARARNSLGLGTGMSRRGRSVFVVGAGGVGVFRVAVRRT